MPNQIDNNPYICNHEIRSQMSYMEFWKDAAERSERGEVQIRCKHCMKFIWDALFFNKENFKHQSL